MTETAATATPETEAPAQEPTTDDAKPEIDWKAKAREWEARAKQNKSAADRLAEIEEANKTEAQRAAERITAAERAAEDARAEALRYKIAAKFQIEDDDADLFLTGSDEETLTRQAQRLTQRSDDASRPRTPRPDPNQGRGGQPVAQTPRDQFAQWAQT